jgi:hypothetical protein
MRGVTKSVIRKFWLWPLCSLAWCLTTLPGAGAASALRVATFSCDVTPSLGQPMIGGDPIHVVDQPLLAKGIVLESGGKRFVLCALDWCLLYNSAHETMRERVAAAAGTEAARVAVQCLHQHNAPMVDTDAQKLLAKIGAENLHISLKDWKDINERLAACVKQSLEHFQTVDRTGTGQAKVERVASSRRVPDATGHITARMSLPKPRLAAKLQALPEGLIDPDVKTITFAQGERPLVRLHFYATHPQVHYRDGRATSDFPGKARAALEQKEGVFQVYFTGCGGDITVGKYNDGSDDCRNGFAERLLAGMEAAVAATTFAPIGPAQWRTYPLRLVFRSDPGYTEADYRARMEDTQGDRAARTYDGSSCLASAQRSARAIELSSLQIGDVHILNLPGEPMVAFQLFAQQLAPEGFVAVAGYGDGAPGYLCTAAAFREGGYEPTDSFVTPQSEEALKKAITLLLGKE